MDVNSRAAAVLATIFDQPGGASVAKPGLNQAPRMSTAIVATTSRAVASTNRNVARIRSSGSVNGFVNKF